MYMDIHLLFNVDYFRLYEPSLLDLKDIKYDSFLGEYLILDATKFWEQNCILQRKEKHTFHSTIPLYKVRIKGIPT